MPLIFHPSIRRIPFTVLARRWRSTEPQILMERLHHPEYSDRQIAKITFNRPKANAMGSVMLQELQECLDELESESASDRCAILTSCSDRVFSAGADLKERATMTQEEAADFVTLLRNTMERVARLPIPTIAAMEGVAVGGGLEIALAADLRIASSSCSLGLPETTLAIIPGAGGTQRLPRLVGVAKAKDLIWTGRRIGGEEALEIGLIDRLSAPGQATEDAINLAWQISANGPVGIRASKEAIDSGMMAGSMEEALEIERQSYARVLPTEDRLEGLAAFQEGRAPIYKGK
jgi:methylglutaconyl-CoA hydratase